MTKGITASVRLTPVLIEEARRQSLLASEKRNSLEEDLWEQNADTTGWE